MRDIRIVLVEDNELELLLGMREGIEVVGSVAGGAEAISVCVPEAGPIACVIKDEGLDRVVESIVAVGAGAGQ